MGAGVFCHISRKRTGVKYKREENKAEQDSVIYEWQVCKLLLQKLKATISFDAMSFPKAQPPCWSRLLIQSMQKLILNLIPLPE